MRDVWRSQKINGLLLAQNAVDQYFLSKVEEPTDFRWLQLEPKEHDFQDMVFQYKEGVYSIVVLRIPKDCHPLFLGNRYTSQLQRQIEHCKENHMVPTVFLCDVASDDPFAQAEDFPLVSTERLCAIANQERLLEENSKGDEKVPMSPWEIKRLGLIYAKKLIKGEDESFITTNDMELRKDAPDFWIRSNSPGIFRVYYYVFTHVEGDGYQKKPIVVSQELKRDLERTRGFRLEIELEADNDDGVIYRWGKEDVSGCLQEMKCLEPQDLLLEDCGLENRKEVLRNIWGTFDSKILEEKAVFYEALAGAVNYRLTTKQMVDGVKNLMHLILDQDKTLEPIAPEEMISSQVRHLIEWEKIGGHLLSAEEKERFAFCVYYAYWLPGKDEGRQVGGMKDLKNREEVLRLLEEDKKCHQERYHYHLRSLEEGNQWDGTYGRKSTNPILCTSLEAAKKLFSNVEYRIEKLPAFSDLDGLHGFVCKNEKGEEEMVYVDYKAAYNTFQLPDYLRKWCKESKEPGTRQ